MTSKYAMAIMAGLVIFSPNFANAADIFDARNDALADQPTHNQADWSGIVLGGILGYSIVNYDISAPGYALDGISGRGFQGCGLVGVQKQAGIFIVGVEGRGCGSNTVTEASGYGESLSVELDYSYAPYLKLGVADDDFLASVLVGYSWQHVQGTTSFSPDVDDTIEGFSGGLVFEHKIGSDNHWAIGLEGIFTQFEKEEAEILNIDPTKYEANIRLTYTIGQ